MGAQGETPPVEPVAAEGVDVPQAIERQRIDELFTALRASTNEKSNPFPVFGAIAKMVNQYAPQILGQAGAQTQDATITARVEGDSYVLEQKYYVPKTLGKVQVPVDSIRVTVSGRGQGITIAAEARAADGTLATPATSISIEGVRDLLSQGRAKPFPILEKLGKFVDRILDNAEAVLPSRHIDAPFDRVPTIAKPTEPGVLETLRASTPASESPHLPSDAITPVKTEIGAALLERAEVMDMPPVAIPLPAQPTGRVAPPPPAVLGVHTVAAEQSDPFEAEDTPIPSLTMPAVSALPKSRTGSIDHAISLLMQAGRLDGGKIVDLGQLVEYFSEVDGHKVRDLVPGHAPQIARDFAADIDGPDAKVVKALGILSRTPSRKGQIRTGFEAGFPRRPNMARISPPNDVGMISVKFSPNALVTTPEGTKTRDLRWLTTESKFVTTLIDEIRYGLRRGDDGAPVEAIITLSGKAGGKLFAGDMQKLVLPLGEGSPLPTQDELRRFYLLWRCLHDGLRGEFSTRSEAIPQNPQG